MELLQDSLWFAKRREKRPENPFSRLWNLKFQKGIFKDFKKIDGKSGCTGIFERGYEQILLRIASFKGYMYEVNVVWKQWSQVWSQIFWMKFMEIFRCPWERHTSIFAASLLAWVSLNQGVQGSNPWSRTDNHCFYRHWSCGDGDFLCVNMRFLTIEPEITMNCKDEVTCREIGRELVADWSQGNK